MNIDNSTMRAVARCTTESVVRYALGYTSAEERMELKAGTALHLAMQAWFESRGDNDRALDAFERSYREWAQANVPDDHRLGWPNVERIMRWWFESHPYATLPYTVHPSRVELGFRIPLIPGVDFVGRLDGVAAFDGALYVLEHKSAGRLSEYWQRRWRLDSQLSGYVKAARRILQHDLVVGVLLNGIEFSKLPASDRKCQRHAVPYIECGHLHAEFKLMVITRTNEQIAAWERTAIKLAREHAKRSGLVELFQEQARERAVNRQPVDDSGIAAWLDHLPMEGMFNYGCPTCSFADWCAAGRRANEITTNFVYDPWNPLDAVGGQTRDHTAHKP